MVKYKEDWYKLYHVHYQQYPDDCIENIYWLEKAAQADFCNPQYVDFKIETEKQWEKYRYLFQMHINLKLIEQHLRLGRTYDKQCIYFYDSPWKDEYLRNMEKALSCYEAGLYYWQEAKVWCEKASENKEMVFNMLGQFFDSGVCLDLFGGTGSLGIEALSRGMSSAYFSEINDDTYKILMSNIKSLGIENATVFHGCRRF